VGQVSGEGDRKRAGLLENLLGRRGSPVAVDIDDDHADHVSRQADRQARPIPAAPPVITAILPSPTSGDSSAIVTRLYLSWPTPASGGAVVVLGAKNPMSISLNFSNSQTWGE
jgi:hypothetical protein